MLTLRKYLKTQKLARDVKENKQAKEYIRNKKRRFNQYQWQQEEQNLLQEKEYFQRPQKKKYKKFVYKEETDSEPEIEESQCVSGNEPIEQEKEKE